MSTDGSIVLRRFIKSVLLVGSLLASASAFASCNEPGRPRCENDDYTQLSAVEARGVRGQSIGVGGITPGGQMIPDDYAPDPDWMPSTTGGGDPNVVVTPLPDLLPGIPRDSEGCGRILIDVDSSVGGGTFRGRLCGDDLILTECTDSPAFGPHLTMCD